MIILIILIYIDIYRSANLCDKSYYDITWYSELFMIFQKSIFDFEIGFNQLIPLKIKSDTNFQIFKLRALSFRNNNEKKLIKLNKIL